MKAGSLFAALCRKTLIRGLPWYRFAIELAGSRLPGRTGRCFGLVVWFRPLALETIPNHIFFRLLSKLADLFVSVTVFEGNPIS